MKITIIISLITFALGFVSSCLENDSKVSRLNKKIKDKDSIILVTSVRLSMVSVANDSLMQIIKDKPTNANTINIDIDKLKAKKNGQIILDATQLQALSCDTVKIIEYYNKLKPKEQRKLLRK